jgi:hypothetical protein
MLIFHGLNGTFKASRSRVLAACRAVTFHPIATLDVSAFVDRRCRDPRDTNYRLHLFVLALLDKPRGRKPGPG